jgi:hypothetical protein
MTIQYLAELFGPQLGLRFELLKTEACHSAVDEMFFNQLEEFCRMVQTEFLARFDEVPEVANSTSRALNFSESLILCPTLEAAQACVRRDLPSALSFVLAIQHMQQQLQVGTLKLPCEAPAFQTRFYLLALTVRACLDTAQPVPA